MKMTRLKKNMFFFVSQKDGISYKKRSCCIISTCTSFSTASCLLSNFNSLFEQYPQGFESLKTHILLHFQKLIFQHRPFRRIHLPKAASAIANAQCFFLIILCPKIYIWRTPAPAIHSLSHWPRPFQSFPGRTESAARYNTH